MVNTQPLQQGAEVWKVHGAWVTQYQPDFGPGIKDRFAMAAALTQDEVDAALEAREIIRYGLIAEDKYKYILFC